MKRLIKANLVEILKLVPLYLPVTAESVDMDIAKLCRGADTDYIFLARREKSWLFPFSAIYTPGSYEYLTYTYALILPYISVAALFLRVSKRIEGTTWGSVTALHYAASALDVETGAALPEPLRGQHIKDMAKRYTSNTRYCTIADMIEFLKTGR